MLFRARSRRSRSPCRINHGAEFLGPRPTLVGSESTTRTTSSLTRSCRCSRSLTVWAAHASGEIASQIAVTDFRNAVEARKGLAGCVRRATRRRHNARHPCGPGKTPRSQAGVAIFERGQKEPEKRGMGTTLSALLLLGERAFIAHVGDSRVYMVRQNQTVQLTEDHSLGQRADPPRQGHARVAGHFAPTPRTERRHACAGSLRNHSNRHD